MNEYCRETFYQTSKSWLAFARWLSAKPEVVVVKCHHYLDGKFRVVTVIAYT